MAARVEKDGSIRFMDPNSGEHKFANGDDFKAWFPKYCESIGYKIVKHETTRFESVGKKLEAVWKNVLQEKAIAKATKSKP